MPPNISGPPKLEIIGDGYDYVRCHYGIEVEIGQRLTVDGRPGVIRTPHPPSGDQYLHVRFDDENQVLPCHPTWRVELEPVDG